MIGLSSPATDLDVAAEFFELFKTPWEPVVPTKRYRVVISTDGRTEDLDAEQLLVYGGVERDVDKAAGVTVRSGDAGDLEGMGYRFPVDGPVAIFEAGASACLPSGAGGAVGYRRPVGSRCVRRVGYDLFGEVRRLLGRGQPAARALVPTLDAHIGLLRGLLIESRVPFVEIPPRPDGFDFICCLTHDIDFCGLRRHGLDRTMAGFLGRASAGTLLDALRGRRPFRDVLRNWRALATVPLVTLGWSADPWQPLDDYRRADGERRRSTFFLLPFKDRPGRAPDGTVDPGRAVRYEAGEIRDELAAVPAETEIAVHGIDAWSDVEAGRREREALQAAAGRSATGVRMHWLYFDDGAPTRLEAAGFEYDSTWGYNDAVGYRAGTSQVFRLPGCARLLELPLAIMDTALFFPDRMNLGPAEGLDLCRRIVAHVRREGGTLVVNWHDRSLSPERLWDERYDALLREIEDGPGQVWFASASDAVGWYRWRRSIAFETGRGDAVRVSAGGPPPAGVGARLRVHRPGGAGTGIEERSFDGGAVQVAC